MGLRRRRNGCIISASFAFLLVFSAAIGMCLGGMVHSGQRERERVRVLSGLGSSPPTCRWRCGRCFPCRAVHVAIQPGRTMPLEYYPEAWRCKCGNNLFMP